MNHKTQCNSKCVSFLNQTLDNKTIDIIFVKHLRKEFSLEKDKKYLNNTFYTETITPIINLNLDVNFRMYFTISSSFSFLLCFEFLFVLKKLYYLYREKILVSKKFFELLFFSRGSNSALDEPIFTK